MTLHLHRQFEVDYDEKDAATWTATARLCDDVHEISLRVDVAVPELVIRDAELTFTRAPYEECQAVKECARALRGLDLRAPDFMRRLMGLFMGSQGCSNVFVLLNLALPALAHFYYPFIAAQRRGEVLDEGDACLALTERNRSRTAGA
jgi:hypothetical protein